MAKTLALPLYKLKWLKNQEQDLANHLYGFWIFFYMYILYLSKLKYSKREHCVQIRLLAIILGSDGSRRGSLGSDESP